ncbi:MAG: sporulation protein [Defluviitaleaceae bacterium]|nr:sporulation protein [Defluviitaleaceae bacterium]
MTNVNENLKMLFGKMEEFVSTKTVVGDPVHIGDVIIIPLVDATFGVGTGLADSSDEKKGAGGGAAGAKLSPSAVIVINQGAAQLVSVKNTDSVNKLVDLVPGILSKLNLGSLFEKKDKKKDDSEE